MKGSESLNQIELSVLVDEISEVRQKKQALQKQTSELKHLQ